MRSPSPVWVGGWCVTVRQAWRRRPALRAGLVTFVTAGVALWGAWNLEQQLEGAGLVVVTGAVPLRALPALGADSRATPMLGEVAEVLERRGAWAQVRLDGAREGWIPLERIASLGRD